MGACFPRPARAGEPDDAKSTTLLPDASKKSAASVLPDPSAFAASTFGAMHSAAMSAVGVPDPRSAVRSLAGGARAQLKEGPRALRVLAFLVCAATLVLNAMEIVNLLFNPISFSLLGTPVGLLVSVYSVACAALGMGLESAVGCLPCHRRAEYWVRVLTRVWGRGLFYLVLGTMQCTQRTLVELACGAGLMAVGCMSLCVSRAASAKLARAQRKMASFRVTDETIIREVFDRHDRDNSGHLDEIELASVALELGAELTGNELVAAFAAIDVDGDRGISFDEFKAWWLREDTVSTCV